MYGWEIRLSYSDAPMVQARYGAYRTRRDARLALDDIQTRLAEDSASGARRLPIDRTGPDDLYAGFAAYGIFKARARDGWGCPVAR